MRVAERDLGDDQSIHQALLAFCSELTLIGTALLPHGEWSQLDAHVALRTSVIGHHVLFHRPFRIDEWLLDLADEPGRQRRLGLRDAATCTTSTARSSPASPSSR